MHSTETRRKYVASQPINITKKYTYSLNNEKLNGT